MNPSNRTPASRGWRNFLVILFILLARSASRADAGSPDLTFAGSADNLIRTVAVQQDGRIVIGGAFTNAGEFPRRYVARLLADGSVDSSFDTSANTNGQVRTLALAGDGAVFIAGTTLTNDVTFPWVIKLTGSGALETNFAAALPDDIFREYPNHLPPGRRPTIESMAVRGDGSLVLVGHDQVAFALRPNGSVLWSELLPVIVPQGGFRSYLDLNSVIEAEHDGFLLFTYRFNALGVPDLTFNQPAVSSPAILPVVQARLPGGAFYAGGRTGTNAAVGAVVKFRPDGTHDESFVPVLLNSPVITGLAIQTDGRLLVAGAFTNVAGQMRRGVARLNPDGSLDATFDPGTGPALGTNHPPGTAASITALALQPDGQILLGGFFEFFNGAPATNLVRLLNDPSGPPQITIAPTNQSVMAGTDVLLHVGATPGLLTYQWQHAGTHLPGATNGSLRIPRVSSEHAGEYMITITNAHGTTNSAPVTLTVLPRPEADGWVDLAGTPTTFANGPVRALKRLPDGAVLVGGDFTSIHGAPRHLVARLNEDGTLDESFDAGVILGPEGFTTIRAILPLSDGRIIIAGAFTNIAGVPRHQIARLHANGAVDLSFDPGGGITAGERLIYALARQSDGRLLVGGTFTSFQNSFRRSLVRLQTNGMLDLTFNAGQLLSAFVVALRPDGTILVGGSGLKALNPNGTEAFFIDPFPNAMIYALKERADGSFLVGGNNSSALLAAISNFGSELPSFARLPSDTRINSQFVRAVEFDECGRLLVAGAIQLSNQTARAAMFRLHANGTVDHTFTNVATDAVAYAVLPGPDGGALLGGAFTRLDNVQTRGLASVHASVPAPVFASISTNQTVNPGRTVTLTVSWSNCVLPRVQWWFGNAPIPGGTNVTLSFMVRPTSGGTYFVVASNSSGMATSAVMTLTVPRPSIAPGSFDWDFLAGAGASNNVLALAVQHDGKVLLGGEFDTVHGHVSRRLARLNADGSWDATFDVSNKITSANGPTPRVFAVLPQGSEHVIAGGNFGSYDGMLAQAMVRTHADGSFDDTFTSVVRPTIVRLLQASDGSLVAAAISSPFLIRYEANGALHTNFNPSFNSLVNVVAEHSGKLIVGGGFTTVNGMTRRFLARLEQNGALDPAFDPDSAFDYGVSALAVQSDGRIVAAGLFSGPGRAAGCKNRPVSFRRCTGFQLRCRERSK